LLSCFCIFQVKYQFALVFQAISSRCGEVLANEKFLQFASEEVMEDILNQEILNIRSEFCLLNAVVRWGEKKCNVKVTEPDQTEEKLATLQAVIKNLLHFIRFLTESCPNFAKICKDPLMNVLTDKQKLQIMSSLSLKDPCLLPDNFSASEEMRKPYKIEASVLLQYTHARNLQCSAVTDPLKFHFSVKHPVYILGLNLFSMKHLNLDEEVEVECILKQEDKMVTWAVCHRSSNCIIDDLEYIRFKWPILLQPGIKYVIHTYHMTSTKVEAAELDLKQFVFTSPLHNKLQFEITLPDPNVRTVHDVYELLFAEPRDDN
jgi:hypothetical protein